MRIPIDDYDDIRYVRRAPEAIAPTRRREPDAPPRNREPVETRNARLQRIANNRQPLDIPRRRYEQSITPEITIERSVDPRHLRARHNLSRTPLIPMRLHEEEKRLLGKVGRFRVVAVRDLAETVYSDDARAAASDLRYLQKQGLVSLDIINARRDRVGQNVSRFEVVTLTEFGERIARNANRINRDQALYHGLVRPREVEHDAQIYRAYRKEAARIEARGGGNLRVRLDFELKSQAQRAIHAARKDDPSRDIDEIKAQVAAALHLPVVDHQIQIPDARIEYDLDQGSRSGCSDIEVVTAAYHAGHLHAKVQAGFALYASSGDRATLCARAEDEHHMLDQIFEL